MYLLPQIDLEAQKGLYKDYQTLKRWTLHPKLVLGGNLNRGATLKSGPLLSTTEGGYEDYMRLCRDSRRIV